MRSDRAWMQAGGVAAMLAVLLATLRVAAQLTVDQELYNPRYPPGMGPFAWYWGPAALEGCAVALAAFGTWKLMRPTNRILVFGGAAAVISAAMLSTGALMSIPMQFRGPSRLAEFACVPLGVWMLCVSAADWRLRRLPTWLRMTGAVLGAVLMVLPAVLVLRLFTVLGLAWWIGLGVTLLRAPRSTSD